MSTVHLGLESQCIVIQQHRRHITKKKWESAGLMDGSYVVGVTAISYPGYGVIINIVSKKIITYRITIGDIPHCTCLDFTKMSSQALGKKGKWVYCKHLYYVFRFLCKVDYESDKFIHAPTYTYNEVYVPT